MISRDFITEWRARAPWVLDRQVEQDLVISRALVELFSRTPIADALAFRGGTALHKLHLAPAARYSEDIDLVHWRGLPGEAADDRATGGPRPPKGGWRPRRPATVRGCRGDPAPSTSIAASSASPASR